MTIHHLPSTTVWYKHIGGKKFVMDLAVYGQSVKIFFLNSFILINMLHKEASPPMLFFLLWQQSNKFCAISKPNTPGVKKWPFKYHQGFVEKDVKSKQAAKPSCF